MAGKAKNSAETRRQEILGILIMAFAILIFLGLISYHPTDYPNSGSVGTIHNWLGLVGSWIGHYLNVYTIGYACILFPFLLFLLGWTIFLQRSFRPLFRLTLYLLALGLFLSTVMAMPEVVSKEGSKYKFSLSGLLGGFVATQLHHFLGTAGSIVVLLTLLLLLLVSATSWSMRGALLSMKGEMSTLFRALKKKRPPKREIPIPGLEQRKPAQAAPPVIRSIEPDKIPKQRPEVHVPEKPRMEGRPQMRPQTAQPQPPQQIKPQTQAPVTGTYVFPPIDLLTPAVPLESRVNKEALEQSAYFLEEKLQEFDVRGNVVGIQPGPVITRYEVQPAPGVKVSRFVSIQDDLALVMKATRVRIVAPIPGKAAVGIELPNDEPALVTLRSVLESRAYQKMPSKLPLALGQTIEGRSYVSDLTHLPHLLVAGATGSGKSVCLNTIIASILYKARPSEVKFVMIDPKKLELSLYKKLRKHHLTTRKDLNEDVITNVSNAVSALRSLEMEMESRYRQLARAGVRNIEDYNRGILEGRITLGEEGQKPHKLPYVILVVDELADLMLTGAREVEEPIARLAQMSRAVGIHLILATQRPSVDVITGVIKANFPSRIAFQVASKTDSRTILDQNGAEKLLGRGDMLFQHPREPALIRIHGAFISTEEVQRIVDHISRQPAEDSYDLPGQTEAGLGSKGMGGRGDRDELFDEAARLVIRHQQGSASLLQRRLRVGYARAGRLIDELEAAGILGPFDGSKAREVLVDESFLEEGDLPAQTEEDET